MKKREKARQRTRSWKICWRLSPRRRVTMDHRTPRQMPPHLMRLTPFDPFSPAGGAHACHGFQQSNRYLNMKKLLMATRGCSNSLFFHLTRLGAHMRKQIVSANIVTSSRKLPLSVCGRFCLGPRTPVRFGYTCESETGEKPLP